MTICALKASVLRCVVGGLVVLCGVAPGRYAVAQAGTPAVVHEEKVGGDRAESRSNTVSALMLSDIHLDPFHDPAKVRLLVDAPASEWGRILDAPDSPNQARDFEALQTACHAKGIDTPNALLHSSLRAVRMQAPEARFITLSGDLIVHNFECRFAHVVPGKTPGDYAAFVEKTIDYVMTELRKAEPGVPLYASLGNNDSGCGDYRMDEHNGFLAATAEIMLRGLPPSEEKDRALADFADGGYYSVTMAAPMRRTRLIVLNDIFMSRSYLTCGGKADSAGGDAQIAWLEKELGEARRQGQRVWVMGHIPPGVDAYGTVRKMKDVCAGGAPTMFLSSGKMGEVLIENADVVRLGIFAHTHMDELRLLEPEGGGTKASPKDMVAVKMVASITPVHGNSPSFTVARVDPATATLVDYSVFTASNHTGIDASWTKEYSYSQAYHEAAFAPPELERLMTEFKDDPEAKTAASRAFIRYFFTGDDSGLIKPLWPEYVCGLSHVTGKGFSDCACASAH